MGACFLEENMETTNTLLIIENTMHNEVGILMLIISGIVVFYLLCSIELRRIRMGKLRKIVEIIRSGHQRKVYAERAKKRED